VLRSRADSGASTWAEGSGGVMGVSLRVTIRHRCVGPGRAGGGVEPAARRRTAHRLGRGRRRRRL